ncbi:MAG: glycosyltransferase [Bdellovibrionales bacterium]|nr:glycosyltransferase [Bdellovibrionales bacterium]
MLQLQGLAHLGLPARALLFNDTLVAERLADKHIPFDVVSEAQPLPAFLAEGIRTVRRVNPSLVVSHGYKEGIIAASCRRPWVAIIHGHQEGYRGWAAFKRASYDVLYRTLLRRQAARVITVSADLGRRIGIDGCTHHRVIHNAYAPATDSAVPFEVKHPAIVCLGRLAGIKRLDLALGAFLRVWSQRREQGVSLPHLYLAGEGPLRERLETEAASSHAKDHVHFLGFIHHPTALLRSADLLLITSDSEGIPTALLEAAASDTPAVCSRVGGIPEVLAALPSYPATLFDAGDEASCAEQITAQLEIQYPPARQEETREHLSKHFSPDIVVRRYAEVYRQVESEHRPGTST